MYLDSFDGTRIFYTHNSLDKEKTVLFVHGGFQGNHTRLKDLMGCFEKEYNVVAPDLRGKGDSHFPEEVDKVKLEDYAKDLFQLVRKESLNNIRFIGVSFGGLVTLKFAELYSSKVDIKKIVLLSSAHRLDKLRGRTKLAEAVYCSIGDKFTSLVKSKKEERDARIDYSTTNGKFSELKYGLKIVKKNSPKTISLRYRMMRAAETYRITKSQLKKIAPEILIIYGKKDFYFPFSVQKELYENTKSTFTLIPKAGHNLYITHTKEVKKKIDKFFKQ